MPIRTDSNANGLFQHIQRANVRTGPHLENASGLIAAHAVKWTLLAITVADEIPRQNPTFACPTAVWLKLFSSDSTCPADPVRLDRGGGVGVRVTVIHGMLHILRGLKHFEMRY